MTNRQTTVNKTDTFHIERLLKTQKLTLLRSGCAFKLSGLHVTPLVTFRHSVGLNTHMFQSAGTQGRSKIT